MGEFLIFSAMAFSSSTSQFTQTNFPFKKSASGPAHQTVKSADNATIANQKVNIACQNVQNSLLSNGTPGTVNLTAISVLTAPG